MTSAQPETADRCRPEHAHVERSSADCDGTYSSEYIVEPNDEELDAKYGDLDFRDRVLTTVVSVWAIDHHATMTVTPEGFEWREQTDEGYTNAEVRWCRDGACDPRATSYRDHRAEAMGY